VTARVITGLDRVLAVERPDWLLVQGDTTTVLAASLVAFYHRVRIGHVEAGLRTGDKWQPYPEEINRRLTDALADVYFAPTPRSKEHLLAEGVPESDIVVTGNTVIDALLMAVDRIDAEGLTNGQEAQNGRRLVLITAHRRENFGTPITNICAAIKELSIRYRSQCDFVYPVHPNPCIREPAYRLLDGLPNLTLTDPLSYMDLVKLLRRAALLLTDSGGLQEEAPSLRVPVLVLRDVTERPEGVAAGVVRVVGTDREAIVEAASRLLDDPEEHRRMATGINPYGDGRASQRIVETLLRDQMTAQRRISDRTDAPVGMRAPCVHSVEASPAQSPRLVVTYSTAP
jgi:UDP-N-acetylglucosamine 2-epimerase (non-hydrolysing)